MLAPLAAALFFPMPIAFGAYPLYDQALKGSALAEKEHTMEVLYGEDRATVGWWNDGTMAQPMEWALWISPNFVSRWLGYLDRRELWTSDQMRDRYQAVSRELDGKITVLVQLVAFPKQSLLDFTDEAPSQPQEIEKVRFVVTYDDVRMQPTVSKVATFQWRDRSYVKQFRWWTYLPWAAPLAPEWMNTKDEPPYGVGDWYASWYLVEFPVVPEIHACKKFEVRIISPRKERVATFPPEKPDLLKNFKIGH